MGKRPRPTDTEKNTEKNKRQRIKNKERKTPGVEESLLCVKQTFKKRNEREKRATQAL